MRAMNVNGVGLLAGGVATLCMSAVMLLSKRLGFQQEHPPKRITKEIVEGATRSRLPEPALNLLTAATHMGYGVFFGSVFEAARGPLRLKRRPIVEGVLFGLGLWVASYKGWVPSLGLMPPPECDRPGRVATMISAHLVYGATLAACLSKFEQMNERSGQYHGG